MSERSDGGDPTVTQDSVNTRIWSQDNVARYAHRLIRPAEVVALVRHGANVSGRVLEIGCGAGRLLGYLVAIGGEVHGIDVSPAMVDYCRRTYPTADVRVGDLRSLAQTVPGPFNAVIAPDNVLDVVAPDERRAVLADVRGLLAPDGVLIFSAHNLASRDGGSAPAGDTNGASGRGGALHRLAQLTPEKAARAIVRIPSRARARKRLAPFEQRAADHAILVDGEGNGAALHYYVRRDDQQRQLEEAGFDLVECFDAEGWAVPAGRDGAGPWLTYVARPRS
jgi:SAM-dependent methyltransferase